MSRLTANGDCRAVAIGWTGWRDVGMATRGSIEAVFESAGIETLSVGQGVEIFVKEALAGGMPGNSRIFKLKSIIGSNSDAQHRLKTCFLFPRAIGWFKKDIGILSGISPMMHNSLQYGTRTIQVPKHFNASNPYTIKTTRIFI